MSVVFAVNRVGVQAFRRVRANVSVRKRPLCVLRLVVRPIPCNGRLCRRYCPLRASHVVFSLDLLGVALHLPSRGAVWRTRFPGEGRWSSPALPRLAKHGGALRAARPARREFKGWRCRLPAHGGTVATLQEQIEGPGCCTLSVAYFSQSSASIRTSAVPRKGRQRRTALDECRAGASRPNRLRRLLGLNRRGNVLGRLPYLVVRP